MRGVINHSDVTLFDRLLKKAQLPIAALKQYIIKMRMKYGGIADFHFQISLNRKLNPLRCMVFIFYLVQWEKYGYYLQWSILYM